MVLEITPDVLSGAKRDNRDRREAIVSLNQHLFTGRKASLVDNQINKPRCNLTFSRRSARNTELIKPDNLSTMHKIDWLMIAIHHKTCQTEPMRDNHLDLLQSESVDVRISILIY